MECVLSYHPGQQTTLKTHIDYKKIPCRHVGKDVIEISASEIAYQKFTKKLIINLSIWLIIKI